MTTAVCTEKAPCTCDVAKADTVNIVNCYDDMATLLNAIKRVWPNADIVGCEFHFKQALRRKMLGNHIAREIDSFWAYFVKTWMKTYDPNDWNIN
jgi:transposase-like protein